MSYVSLIAFDVVDGRNEDFEAAFGDTGMLTRPRAIAGYQGATLHRSVTNPGRYIVIGQWDTVESYRAWQARSLDGDPEALARLMATLVDPVPGDLFRAVADG